MPKALKSQWEFGELFPAEAVRKVLTVSELTGSIRRILEKEIGQVSVTWEISNLRIQSSGHIYFSIKDAEAQLACVLFRAEAASVNRDYLQDGQKVVLEGELTVYEARGQYQLRVASVQLQGLGALQAAFERLKQKLNAEGLFDQSHKRSIPQFPQAIGLVTSPVGAAIRDVLHTVQRRNPALQIILASCRVQGAGAAQEIAAAISTLNDWTRSKPSLNLDLILLTRGGGSLEDLWAFNEEIVARAIYGSRLPVISAVGHEIDFTISDFVADFRAATPTAAAEIITEGIFSRKQYLLESKSVLSSLLQRRLQEKKDELAALIRLLSRGHPKRKLAQQAQRLDDLQAGLARCYRQHLRHKDGAFRTAAARLLRLKPQALLNLRKEKLLQLTDRLRCQLPLLLNARRDRIRSAETRLRLLSPLNVLERGYSITTKSTTGEVVRKSTQVKAGEEIISRVGQGEVRSITKESLPPNTNSGITR